MHTPNILKSPTYFVCMRKVLVEMILLLATETSSLHIWLVADTIDLITEYQVFLWGKGGAGDEASHVYIYVHTIHLFIIRV